MADMRKISWLIPIAVFFSAVSLVAQTAKPAAPPKPAGPRPAAAASAQKAVGTVKDLMDFMVIPASQFLFGAVGSEEGPNGLVEKAPKNDSDWADVRRNVVLLS